MPFLAALATGLLLFASDHPLRLWWLQLVAFVPFWLALAAHQRAGRSLAVLGVCLAAGYALPLLMVLGTAVPIVVAALAVLVQWTLVAIVAGRLVVRSPVLGALGAAGVVTVFELVMWNGVPLFGTAQCFARPLSNAPAAVAFVAWTGVAGVVFVVTATQALAATALRARRRAAPLAVVAALVAAAAAIDVVRWHRPLGAPMRVAAYGWGFDGLPIPDGTVAALDGVLADAKASGAQLVVTPETGFDDSNVPGKADEIFPRVVKKHGIAVALGIWLHGSHDNRIWFIDGDGTIRAQYRKTHLVPWLERCVAGDGTLAHTTVGGVAVGGMICQDDNFTDIARAYGRDATPLLAVPTNDWAKIRFAHFDNSRFRAIENGYAVVRAASNGISAIVSPRGEVLVSCDHTAAGPQLIAGDVPVGDGVATPYARCGDWPMLVLAVVLMLLAWRRRPPD